MLLFGLLQCGLIVQMYTHMLRLDAINTVKEIPFQTQELVDVLKEKRYTLMIPNKYQWMYVAILNSTRSPYYELRQTLKGNPVRFLPEEVTDEIFEIEKQAVMYFDIINETKNLVGVVENDQITGFVVDDYCDFVFLDVRFLSFTIKSITSKNSKNWSLPYFLVYVFRLKIS